MPRIFMHLTHQQVDEVIDKYKQGQSSGFLAREYSVSDTAILQHLKKHGIERRKGKISKSDIKFILDNYMNGKPTTDIAKELNVNVSTICDHLALNNIARHGNKKYSVNEKYFGVVDMPIKAYWLGFLMADGCILHRGNISYGVKVKLKEADIDILTAFKSDIGSEHPVKIFIENGYPQVSLQINSTHIAHDLKNYGCVPAKSLILKFPSNLDKALYPHFIRGYSDGDGSVMVNRSNNQIYWEIAGTLPFLTEIQRIMMDSCNLKKINIRRQKNIFCLRYGGNKQTLRIKDYLYENADRFMERKFMKFNTFN